MNCIRFSVFWLRSTSAQLALFSLLCFSSMGANLPAEDLYFRSDQGLARGDQLKAGQFDFSAVPKWKCKLPSGHSTPIVFANRIAVTTYEAQTEKLAVVVVDRDNGEMVWKRETNTERIEDFHSAGSPAAATIATDGERLYAFFGSYGVICYDLSGNQIWSRPLGPFQDEFGAASSPVLVGNLLVLNQDHDHNNLLLALNKQTGEEVWSVPRDEFTRSYSTPVVANVNGTSQLIVAGSLTLTGYEPQSGRRLWWVDGLARIVNPTPVVRDDVVFVATWAPGGDTEQRVAMDDWQDAERDYDANGDAKIQREELLPGPVLQRFFRMDIDQDGGLDQAEWEKHADVFARAENSLIALRLGASGDAVRNVLWRQNRGLPFVASPVVHNDCVFMIKDGGILTAVDANDGSLKRRGRLKAAGTYYASPVAAGDYLYIASVSGVMHTVSSDANWKLIGHHDFGVSIYATPVVVDNQIYVRTTDALYRFDN